MFALDWKKPVGINRLKEYFGESIDTRLAEPVILGFKKDKLGELHYRQDGGADEFYIERGPVNINNARLVTT